MSQIPQNIMKAHDPNDDPFAALSDDSTNQLQSPLEYGSGISYFVQQTNDSNSKEEHPTADKEEPSSFSTDEDNSKAVEDDSDNGTGEEEQDQKEE